jgi:1-acyl-sn-glycerol-3-phosphate acyltransferase
VRSPRFLALARRYARRRLARGLDGVAVAGLDAAREGARRAPLLLVANHVGWWDSFLVVALDEALATEGYALMDAANLRRLPLFARLGALPLDRSGTSRWRAGMDAAAARLDRPGRALWIFPQGEHRPSHLRPLGFRPGLRHLLRRLPHARVVPVALQYAWGELPRPRAHVDVGPAASAAGLTAAGVEAALEAALARIDGVLSGASPPPPLLVAPRGGRAGGAAGGRLPGGRGRG